MFLLHVVHLKGLPLIRKRWFSFAQQASLVSFDSVYILKDPFVAFPSEVRVPR